MNRRIWEGKGDGRGRKLGGCGKEGMEGQNSKAKKQGKQVGRVQ